MRRPPLHGKAMISTPVARPFADRSTRDTRRFKDLRSPALSLGLACALVPSLAAALDPGEDGVRVTIPVSGIVDIAQAVVVDANGNVVLAGSGGGGNTSVLARITPAGGVDLGFGTGGGIASHDLSFNSGDSLRALVHDSASGYFGCGVFNNVSAGTAQDFVVAHFDSSGALVAAFNGSGYAVTSFLQSGSGAALVDQCNAVALQSDGMIVSAGVTNQTGHPHVALTRHTAQGQPDNNFGSAGKLAIDASQNPNGDSEARALLIQPDGKLLIAGYAAGAGNYEFLIMRLLVDGTPDPDFGTGGITRTPIGLGEDIANAMVLQPNGYVVLAGSAYIGGHNDFALARYTSAGVLDPNFSGGKVTTPVGPGEDDANALLLMPWGRLVAAGSARVSTGGTGTDLAIVAYNANGTLDGYFGTAGKRMLNVSDLDSIVYGLASDVGRAHFWAVGTAHPSILDSQDFLAIEFGLPDTIFRHGFDTSTAP